MTVKICAIAAMSENRVIGRDGKLPWHIPDDLKHFKRVTMGKPVIMGRKTFESLGKPLPNRMNIVVSRGDFSAPGVQSFRDIPTAIEAGCAQENGATEIMLIGGGQIYALALPLTERIYLTVVHQTIDGDTFFPDLDKNDWLEAARDDRDGFSFLTLDRIRPA